MVNSKVVFYSLLGLASIALSFLVSWLFLIPAVVIIFINQKELTKKQKK
jgi:hypothetical protein